MNPGGMQVEFFSWGRVKRTASEPPAGSHQWGEVREGGKGMEHGTTPGQGPPWQAGQVPGSHLGGTGYSHH